MGSNMIHRAKCRISASQLRVAYDNFLALDIPELDLTANTLAIVGHNGAGKSTLIKSLLNLLPLQEGRLSAQYESSAENITLVPDKHMAFCPETGAVFADIKVEAYIRLWCRIKMGDPNYYKKEGAAIVELLDLPPLLHKLGRELSKGQKRRVQTSIGFLTKPKFFLFDEPFEGLDVQKARELGNIILDNNEKITYVLATHRMDIVERLADYVLVLKNGRVVTLGSVADVARTLAGHGIILRNTNGYEELVPLLRKTFVKAVINRIGDQIALVGNQLEAGAISQFCIENGFQNIVVSEEQPSLVDALNFHLQSF